MGPYTVTSVYSKNRLINAVRFDEKLIDIPVPVYLPLPEIGSLVTITDNAVVAVLTLPSLEETSDQVYDVPFTEPGDYLTHVPGRGFIGFMKSAKSLILGKAMHSNTMRFTPDGITIQAPSINFLGTGITFQLKDEDPFDVNSTVSLDMVLGRLLKVSLSPDSAYLNLLDDMFEVELNTTRFKATLMSNRATGERVTLAEETFTGKGTSSSAEGGKDFVFSSAVSAKLQKTLKAVVNDAMELNAKQLKIDSATKMSLHGESAIVGADKEVVLNAPNITLNATPGAAPAGTIKIANGQFSSITLSPTGGVGIGATSIIELGGTGEFATNGLNTMMLLTNVVAALQTIATACGGFPPTSGANAANIFISQAMGMLGQVINPVIQMTAGPCMPNQLPV